MATPEAGAGGAPVWVKPGWLTIPAADCSPPPSGIAQPGRIIVFGASALPAAAWTALADPHCDLEMLELALRQPLDKHRLDVALSVGRHAVERAKLANRQRVVLIALVPTALMGIKTPLAQDECGSGACYQWLRHWGTPELAALVGAQIASAQLGLYSPISIAFMPRRIRPCLSTSSTFTRT